MKERIFQKKTQKKAEMQKKTAKKAGGDPTMGCISKIAYFKNWPILKIGLFKNEAISKNRPISKICFFKQAYFKN